MAHLTLLPKPKTTPASKVSYSDLTEQKFETTEIQILHIIVSLQVCAARKGTITDLRQTYI